MTRAEFIKEAVKQLWGVPLDEESFGRDEFAFKSCDGIQCPPDENPKDIFACNKCPYRDFWEKEV